MQRTNFLITWLLNNKLFVLVGSIILGLFALILLNNSHVEKSPQQALAKAATSIYPSPIAIDGLEWMRCAVGQKWEGETCTGEPQRFNFDAAQMAATDLNANGGDHGKADWRVPNIRELASLRVCSAGFQGKVDVKDGGPPLDEMCADGSSAPTIDTKHFPGTNKFIFWSSSPNLNDISLVWVLYTNVGGVFNDGKRADGDYFVRLVRTIQ